MSEFEINPKRVGSNLQLLEQSAIILDRNREKVIGISSSLSLSGCTENTVRGSLSDVLSDLQNHIKGTTDMKSALSDVISQYENAEQKLLKNKGNRSIKGKVPQNQGENVISENSDGKDFWYNIIRGFQDNYWENFADNLRDALLEGSGNLIVKVGGWINAVTATAVGVGKHAFIIVNPAVTPITSQIISVGNKIVTGAKWGLPVLGGVIDFLSLKSKGESNQDAIVKAGAHVAIGLAGSAIGASIGSVIPGIGTVAGAAVGFVLGVAITTFGNAAFDYTYDNWNEVVDGVKTVGTQVVTNIGEALEDVGQAVTGIWNQLGTIFG